ncbi:ATP-binding cassette domain-containing protein [Brevibacillus sp. SYP-B805]|uniref:ATP-binding cassette domain-containing protein n=1 Tax=Brevibacillus sp. SYP-B805 TaxID=1578199 RepID=UPI0013EA4D8C|nr:ATP-binding cassette domain-containing protein [Brevibacillus sp. SYP-B805]NGQ95877.1 ATP-binding cassette domain-containing protein [Brevibacillus sp. SYP-B805]
MTGLRIHHLLVSAGNREILRIEQAAFATGRIHAVVGPSGAGKSTLLRAINLLERPVTGHLYFWEHELSLAAHSAAQALAIQRQMVLVAQQPVMFQATVFDNVALGLRYRKIDKQTIAAKVTRALERVELASIAKQQATTLSGGEAQRVALARAIVLEPRLLLLDEPTASLDPYNVTIIEQVIRSLNREQGTTVIMVTHNLAQARRLADACLFLHKGQLVEMSDADTFFRSPRSAELQDFLSGRMIC